MVPDPMVAPAAADPPAEPEPEAPRRPRDNSVYVGSVSALGSAQRAAVEDFLAASDRLARAQAAGNNITVALAPPSKRTDRKGRSETAAWRLVNRAAELAVGRAAAGVTSVQLTEAAVEEAQADLDRAIAELQRVARGDPMITALLTGRPPGGDGFGGRIASAQAGQGNPPTLTGLVSYPVPFAPIVSRFGYRIDPFSGDVDFHPGLDIAASQGTPILAAAAGTVLVAGDSGGYGNAVVLDNGNSIATLYGHMVSVAVSPGQQVAAGDVIGYVGSTGMSTGPHLHFEVRLHGVAVDPLPMLTD
jgi:murein DD-endopeptidase MepM/ murein hydrolase activator NlpD